MLDIVIYAAKLTGVIGAQVRISFCIILFVVVVN